MYNSYSKSNSSNYGKSGYNNRSGYGSVSASNKPQLPDLSEKKLPENYVDQAEKKMKELFDQKVKLTTSKIRNILSMISDIYNVEINRTETTLLPENQNRIQMVRVRLAYECGREDTVKKFVYETDLLSYIKGIHDSRNEFIRFARYMEALVAYHRFYGGDN